MSASLRRLARLIGPALLALVCSPGLAAGYADPDLARSRAWIGDYLPVDVEPAPNHRRPHCHRGAEKLVCRVWASPGEGGRLYRTGHKALDEERVYLVQRETELGSLRFADVVVFARTASGEFVVRPSAAAATGAASSPPLEVWSPERGHGKRRAGPRSENDYAMGFFATQPHLAGIVPPDLMGVGAPNARYSDCDRGAMKLRCGTFYSAKERLRYRLSFGTNEQGRTTVYDVWRETGPGSGDLDVYAQWADGPANLLVEICGPARPRPVNVASAPATGSGAADAPKPGGLNGITRTLNAVVGR